MDTAPDLDDTLRQASERATGTVPLAVQLHGVEFLDSAGLGVLLMWHRRCEAIGTHLVLVAPTRPIARHLALTGLDQILTVVPDLAAWQSKSITHSDDS